MWGGQRDASRPDHPRACGANAVQGKGCPAVDGSSPRVRGKRAAIDGRHACIRIIPARAGQTPERP